MSPTRVSLVRPSWLSRVLLASILVLFCAAPTPGDIGGCGQPADDLDAALFFKTLKYTDCQSCQACGFATQACITACDVSKPPETEFPTGCAPLAHDGEVCLRTLQQSTCDDYALYVRDDAPTRPSECQFCPVRP